MATTMTRYQPETGMTRLPDLMDRLFKESFVLPTFLDRFTEGGTARPGLAANLYETNDAYVLQVALPAVNPDNVDIQVVGREVSIKGQFQSWAPENAKWLWQGIPTGEFYQTFTLPVEVEGDSAQASYEYGILSITLPKVEHARPKSIQVTVSK